MKKPKNRNKKRQVLISIQKQRFCRRLREKISKLKRRKAAHKENVRLSKKYSKNKVEVKERSGKKVRKQGYKDLVVPEKLDLTKNYSETVEFIKNLKSYALGLRRPVRLVFSELKEISPEALLLLLAELYRCRMIFGKHKITGTYPINKNIERIMEASGFFELLDVIQRNPARTKKYPLEYIKFITGNKLIATAPMELRDALLGNVVSMGILAKKRLYRAITEAMINVGQHAYPKNQRKKYKIRNEWWMSGHVNLNSNKLVIIFCDLGVGIPTTLPKIHGLEKIVSALSLLPGIKPNDAEMIKAGMEIGRTSTGLAGRGKGLNDLRKFVDDTGGGELNIFSRKGHYQYLVDSPEILYNHRYSIGGTLIKWSVPINNVTDWISNTEESYVSNEDN